MCFPEADLEQA